MSEDSVFESKMPYDLRLYYADIVGVSLQRIALARFDRKFSEYWAGILDLWTIVQHRIKEKGKEKTFAEHKKEAIDLFNLNKETFLGKAQNPKAATLLLDKLMEIESYIYFKMKEADIFGSEYYEEA
jgi:hypothetical protein